MKQTVHRLRQIESFGLYCLAFTLPIMESPKYIALALFVIGSLGRRIVDPANRFRRPDLFEWILLALWGVALASVLVNWPLPSGVKGLRATSCLVFLFWALYRNDLSPARLRIMLWMLIAGVVVGLVWGLWEWMSGLRPHLEFHSAGIVTQSSIYLGVSIYVMGGMLLDTVSGFGARTRLAVALCTLFSMVGLLLMGSRGGLLAVIFGLLLLIPVLFRHKRFRIAIGAGFPVALMTVAGILMFTDSPAVVGRVMHLSSNIDQGGLKLDDDRNNDMFRLDHWMVGYAQATQGEGLLLGIGPANFTAIDVERLRFPRPLVTYPSIWQKPHHAHNLFLTKWAEEGLLGLAAFVSFLGLVCVRLFRYRPRHGQIDGLWIACLGALVVPVVAGFFNSSFGNEFAWLAMMMMGLSMGRLAGGTRPGDTPLPI